VRGGRRELQVGEDYTSLSKSERTGGPNMFAYVLLANSFGSVENSSIPGP
jgi:hypothetical protein